MERKRSAARTGATPRVGVPDTPYTPAHRGNRVDATLGVSILFGNSTTHTKAAADFVDAGHIRPASVSVLSRLCLDTTAAADNTLGGDGSVYHSFRALIRGHLELYGPRTGVWDHVRDVIGLVGGDVCKLKCKAWSSALGMPAMSTWLRSVSLQQLCDNDWWWLVKRVLKHRTHSCDERTAAPRVAAERGNVHMVKHVCCCHGVMTHDADAGVGASNALGQAALNGHLKVVHSVHTANGPWCGGGNDNWAIQAACHKRHLHVVQLLKFSTQCTCARSQHNVV